MTVTRTMSVQQALRELKLVDKRITDSYSGKSLVRAVASSHTTVAGKTVTEFNKEADAAYQSIMDLRSQRDAIRKAINYSNATTKIVIGGVEMTVAEAIAKKAELPEDKNLLAYLNQQIVIAMRDSSNMEAVLTDTATKLAAQLYTDKEKGTVSADFTKFVNEYLEKHKPKIVGLSDAEQKRDKLKLELETFEAEVDWKLTESNVITTIEVTV